MQMTSSGHVLDNPSWFSLTSRHAHFALGTDLVKAYPSDVSIVTALADHSDAAFADFERLVKADETILLFEANPPHIPGWLIQESFHLNQMVCQQRVPQPKLSVDVVHLNASNVPEIMQLIEATHPLPFSPRTIELGHFIGIRQQGQLVAMAGERSWMPGYHEIATLCTHPDWQGRGYARMLSSILINEIWDDNETPFLHFRPENEAAKHLYERLNFRTRCLMTGYIIRQSPLSSVSH